AGTGRASRPRCLDRPVPGHGRRPVTAYGQDRLVGLGEAALATEGCDEVEVFLRRGDYALTRFADSRIHQNVARTDGTARVRVVVGRNRVAVVATNDLTAEGVRAAAEQARE